VENSEFLVADGVFKTETQLHTVQASQQSLSSKSLSVALLSCLCAGRSYWN